jgi:hypothetical protein
MAFDGSVARDNYTGVWDAAHIGVVTAGVVVRGSAF